MRADDKKHAIELRRQGLTYREVREQMTVAKSTLSLWFREVKLSKPQIQRITDKRRHAQLRGAAARRTQRIDSTEQITMAAIKDVKALSSKEKWLVGVVLYWAEGSKEKEGQWGSPMQFGNSDPRMALLFKKWLLEVIGIHPSQIKYEIYIHENNKHRLAVVREHWARALGISVDDLTRIYFKRHNPKTNRKNQGNEYYGLVRISVRASSKLNRQISGWIEGIYRNWGMV